MLVFVVLLVATAGAAQETGTQEPSPAGAVPGDSSYVCICLSAANEQRDIVDWARYHEALGVDRIYVVDSGESLRPVLEGAGLVQSGLVRHILASNATELQEDILNTTGRLINAKYKQLLAYSLCLRDFRLQHRWMAFIDADEYLTVREANATLVSILADYEAYGGVGVNWRMYGAGGRLERPRAPAPDAYHSCYPVGEPENVHIKTVANTAYVARAGGAHHAEYRRGYYAVTTDRRRVLGPKSAAPVYDRLVLRHYVSKSLWDYSQKILRGSGMSRVKTMPYFHHVQIRAWQDCRRAAAWQDGGPEQVAPATMLRAFPLDAEGNALSWEAALATSRAAGGARGEEAVRVGTGHIPDVAGTGAGAVAASAETGGAATGGGAMESAGTGGIAAEGTVAGGAVTGGAVVKSAVAGGAAAEGATIGGAAAEGATIGGAAAESALTEGVVADRTTAGEVSTNATSAAGTSAGGATAVPAGPGAAIGSPGTPAGAMVASGMAASSEASAQTGAADPVA
ncbi:hypothetical protein ACKKBF_B21660 [Auxenochlorella protothecoides x Auxenochlorella symbiontica]